MFLWMFCGIHLKTLHSNKRCTVEYCNEATRKLSELLNARVIFIENNEEILITRSKHFGFLFNIKKNTFRYTNNSLFCLIH